MLTPQNWKEYELIDTGDGMKLERWGTFVLARPDPQALWPKERPELWNTAVGVYTRSPTGGGSWKFKKDLPERWKVSYGNLNFLVRPTDFKHTGLFPEQAVNWDWLSEIIRESCLVNRESPRILNLFAYTGAATVACAAAGTKVTHVDASKGIVTWARENLEASGLGDKEVRWIIDDVFKFVQREAKRGVKYDGIIMDPPSYGRGTKGETWKIEKMLWPLVQECTKTLSDNPLFFLINSYTSGLPATVIGNVLESGMKKYVGNIETHELGLKGSATGKILPAGVTARWQQKSS